MNRYDQIFGFDGLSAFIRNIPRQKVDYASMALIRHREDGHGQDDDEQIARQFGLKGMDEFWEIKFSEPMTCKAFGHTLAVHLAAPREPIQGFEAHIRQALRAARSYGQPWFMEIPDSPPSNKLSHPYRWAHLPGEMPRETRAVIAHVIPPDPPVDGIDLNKLRVRPREAALWMLGNDMRRHLVPPSLAAAMAPKALEVPLASPGHPEVGRPKGSGFSNLDEPFVQTVVDLVRSGRQPSVLAAATLVVGNGADIAGNGDVQSKIRRIQRLASGLLSAEKIGE